MSKDKFYILHACSFVLHATSSVIGFVISQDSRIDIPLYANYISYNKSNPNSLYIYEKKPPHFIGTLNPLIILSIVELITALWQFVYIYEVWRATTLEKWNTRPTRWAEYAVTATLITLTNVVSTGGNDFMLFIVVLGSSVALQVCGYQSEVFWQPVVERPWNSKFLTLLVTQLQGYILLGTVIGAVVAQSTSNDNGDQAWRDQTGIYAAYFISFGINSLLRAFNVSEWKSFLFTEEVYAVLSLTSKLSIFWLAVAATRRALERNGRIEQAGVDWDAVRYCAMSLPLAFLITYVSVVMLHKNTRKVKESGAEKANFVLRL